MQIIKGLFRFDQGVQVQSSHSGSQIHVVGFDIEAFPSSGVDLPDQIQSEDNGGRKVAFEEGFRVGFFVYRLWEGIEILR